MKHDVERFMQNQLWILRNGRIIYISDVTPFNKFHSSDADRMATFRFVRPLDKGANVFDSDLFVFAIGKTNFGINMANTKEVSLETLENQAAYLMGGLTPEIEKKFLASAAR